MFVRFGLSDVFYCQARSKLELSGLETMLQHTANRLSFNLDNPLDLIRTMTSHSPPLKKGGLGGI